MGLFAKKMLSMFLFLSLSIGMMSCKIVNNPVNEQTQKKKSVVNIKNENANTQKQLSIWTIFSDPQSLDGNSKAFYKALESIKKEMPDIKINHEGSPMDSIYKKKIKVALASNELPDIFFMWGAGFAKPFVDSCEVLPVDDYMNRDGTFDKLKQGTYDNFTYDGKVYGIPYSIAVASLYCNTELFDKYDVKLPETWDDLIKAVTVFRSNGVDPISLGEKDMWPGMFWHASIALRTAGAKACTRVINKEGSFESPEFIEASKKFTELVNLKAFNDDYMGTSYNDSKAYFLSGKIPMYLMGSWINSEIESYDSQVKGKVAALKFPIIEGGKGNADEFFGGCGETFMINSETQDKDTAYSVVKYITEYISNKQSLVGSGIPAWKGNIESVPQSNPLSRQISELTDSANSFVYWWDVVLDVKSSEAYLKQLSALMEEEKTPEQFSRDLQQEMSQNKD